MKYSIAMTVCNSLDFPKHWRKGLIDVVPGHNYLEQTMTSLEKSGLFNSSIDSELILCDSGSKDVSYLDRYKSKAIIYKAEWPMCINENTYRALHIAAERTDKYVILLQDDILVCKQWIENVDRFISKYYTNEYPMVIFYTPYSEIKDKLDNDEKFWQYPIDKFYGLQCVVLRKADAANLADTMMKKFVNRRPKFTKGADLAVKTWVEEYYQNSNNFLACVPCLVEHLGIDSTLNSPKHESFTFKGEDIDPKVGL